MAFSPPAQQMGQPMLFTSPYGAPYGVQMAVSPPTREACAFGGYAAGSEASMSMDGSADYSAQMMYAQPQQQHWDGSGQAGEQQQYAPMATDESGYYAAQQPAAHGYYGADGGFYHGMHPQQGYIAAQPPQYYAHPGACANGACSGRPVRRPGSPRDRSETATPSSKRSRRSVRGAVGPGPGDTRQPPGKRTPPARRRPRSGLKATPQTPAAHAACADEIAWTTAAPHAGRGTVPWQ